MVPSAECDTDHRLPFMEYRLAKKPYNFPRKGKAQRCGQIAVENLRAMGTTDSVHHKMVDGYQRCLANQLSGMNANAGALQEETIDVKWDKLKSGIVAAAEALLGTSKRRYKDWFSAVKEHVEAALVGRDRLFQKRL